MVGCDKGDDGSEGGEDDFAQNVSCGDSVKYDIYSRI